VKLYPLREPFSSGKQTDPPRHCLASLGNTKERCLLLFGFARLGHARVLACAKTKKFPFIFLAPPSPPHPSAAKRKKKWKGNFWFCFAVSVSEKSNLILTFLFALFSTFTATEALPLGVLWLFEALVTSTENSGNS